MTEATWLTCSNPDELLAALDGQSLTTYRKLRLYACACCRSLPGYLESEPDRASLELAELEADGLDGGREFPDEVFDIRWYRRDEWNSASRAITSYQDALWDTHDLHDASGTKRAMVLGDGNYWLGSLLHDIFGNPFRPATVDPDWLTTDVAALARGVYDERGFDRMPILADALQDAGCDNDDILNHCRDASQVHVRGCWVIDLLTGRA